MSSIGSILLAAAVMAALSQAAKGSDGERLSATAELPDPFLRPDGKRMTTPRAWKEQRRVLLEQALRYEYGPLPPIPNNVRGVEATFPHNNATGSVERRVLLTMGPDSVVQTHLLLTIPSGKGPFPVIVRGDLNWGRVKPEIAEAVVKRGYLLAEFNREEIAPDSAAKGGVYAAYPDYTGGRLAAWAWGFHRVIDYLTTLPFVDKRHIAVTGHSRGGKAALLAGATDERIALTAPNNSGCGGAGCYRFQGENSEDIAAILKNFPFWFQPHFAEFIGHTDRLPLDQHTVKALVAPRALLNTEGLGDLWANPKGTQQTYLAAREVYAFLGVPERIGIVFRPGPHEHNADDWAALLDFADKQFFGKSEARHFDVLAFPDLPRAFSWKAPTAETGKKSASQE